MADWQPKNLSVVVPTYNRPDLLAMALDGLANQTWPRDRFEVIVIDDGGERPAAPVVAGATGRGLPVRTERQENAGPSAARNRGARLATGDVLVFLDDDCVPRPTWLAEHAAGHVRRRLATTGRIAWHASVPLTPLLRYVTDRFLFDFSVIGVADDAPMNTFYTANAAVDRELALEVGLFDESFRRAAWEDIEFAYRLRLAGTRFVFRNEAVVEHLRGFDLAGFLRRERLAGQAAVRFWAKHPELKHLTRADHLIGEGVEMTFYDSAARFAWLVGMAEALGGGGPAARSLAVVLDGLADAPDMDRWRDSYVREREREARQWLWARQATVDALHGRLDKMEGDALAAQRVAKDRALEIERLTAELARVQAAFAAQGDWAPRPLEQQTYRLAADRPRARLQRWLRRLLFGGR